MKKNGKTQTWWFTHDNSLHPKLECEDVKAGYCVNTGTSGFEIQNDKSHKYNYHEYLVRNPEGYVYKEIVNGNGCKHENNQQLIY